MKRLLLLILCVVSFPAVSSHIVGGEFEMTHVADVNRYRIRLILYFDRRNGNPGAQDQFIAIRIFRKRDHRAMRDLTLRLQSVSEVEYFQPDCSDGSIVTDRLVYVYNGSTDQLIALPAAEFSDPEGYYLSWERCCRNYTITNIVSEDPNFGGQYAGQTFYLEFPPVTKNGEPFINSSPRLFPPLSDYACPRRLYFVDFSGVDDDGDSLVYTLVKPYNTLSGDALPPVNQLPRAGPYPEINWRFPFTDGNIMGGLPDLNISPDGLLTVTPQFQGLFVFAVKCIEYRNGVQIGEIRRDFQMLVQENCPIAQPPVIEAKPLDAADAGYVRDKLNVTFSNNVTDDQRCVEIRVTDPDSQSPDDGKTEDVHIRAIPLGFRDNVSEILPEITEATLVDGSAATFTVCFPQCPFVNGPYQIGIISYDDACTLPLLDTIVVTVNVEPPANSPPVFQQHQVTATIPEGSAQPTWNIIATDADMDTLELWPIVGAGFVWEDYGFTYTPTVDTDGRIQATLTWDTRCDIVDFSQRTDFEFKFLVDDYDVCDVLPPDTMKFKLKMDLYNFHPPEIEYGPDPSSDTVHLTKKIYELLSFDVNGTDADNDNLVLTGAGMDFNMNDYLVAFPGDNDNGNVTSPFTWTIDCQQVDLDEKDEFAFRFIVVDEHNRCNYYLADTLDVIVKIEPPDNTPPVITVEGSADDAALAYTLGQAINLTVTGTDAEVSPQDRLTLELIDSTGNVAPQGFAFDNAQGIGTVSSEFKWTPDCSIYENELYENDYTFTFRVTDDRCFNDDGDTITVDLKIKDVEKKEAEFLPPNFISPNGDGRNDFFAMVKVADEMTGELISILPNDNCTGTFVSIMVYNRWGKTVYESESRDFRWTAEGEAAGVYYYLVNYTNKHYKGLITVSFFDSESNR